MRMKKSVLVLIILIALFSFLGVKLYRGVFSEEALKQKSIDEEYVKVKELIAETNRLNARQRKILNSEGIHSSYANLDVRKKQAIIKIDMLLSYLEEKYSKNFTYVGYSDSGFGTLTAYATDDAKKRSITASLDWDSEENNYNYDDTYYMEVIASDEYSKIIYNRLKELSPDARFFVDVKVNNIYDESEISIANCSADINIVMENIFSSQNETKEFLNEFCDWLISEAGNHGNYVFFMTLDSEEIDNANYYNYIDSYYRKDLYAYSVKCELDENGNKRFWEEENGH